MRKVLIIGVILLATLAGYVLGSRYPLEGFSFFPGGDSDEGIAGDVRLVITTERIDGGGPVPDLEIDLAPQPGQPPLGGVSRTNADGVAEFNVQPGDYYIFFNMSDFPSDLTMPEAERVTVVEGVVNERSILLTPK